MKQPTQRAPSDITLVSEHEVSAIAEHAMRTVRPRVALMPDVLSAFDMSARYLRGEATEADMSAALRSARMAVDTAVAESESAREASRYAYVEGYAYDECTAEALAQANSRVRAARAAHYAMSAVYASRHFSYPEYYVADFARRAIAACD